MLPHILLVDDDPSIARCLGRLLKKEGYQVLIAHTGIQALSLLEQEAVEMVISDLSLDDMDGIDLLQKVKEKWPSILRVVLSGHVDLDLDQAVKRGELSGFLAKPWDNIELLHTVGSAFVANVVLHKSPDGTCSPANP